MKSSFPSSKGSLNCHSCSDVPCLIPLTALSIRQQEWRHQKRSAWVPKKYCNIIDITLYASIDLPYFEIIEI